MKEKFLKYLFSNQLMALLFIAFSTAMAFGTFIESWYSTDTAKIWVYNAWWFELILALFMVNFFGNIFKYRLLKKEKWATLSIHLSFILIIFGAFITRYFGFEGVMPIREGASESTFLSEKTYLTVFIEGEIDGVPQRKTLEKEFLLSEHTDNYFEWNNEFNGQDFSIRYDNFAEDVSEQLVLDDEGERYIKIVESSDGTRHDHSLKEGEVANIHNLLFSLNNPIAGAINIRSEGGLHYITTPFDGTYLRMADQQSGTVQQGVEQELQLRSLYNLKGFQFVIPEPPLRGKFDWVKSEEGAPGVQDALKLNVVSKGENSSITVLGGKGIVNNMKKISVGGLDFFFKYGSKSLALPFAIRLNDFIAEKYPGTEKSYSSFMSRITVEEEKAFDYDIYMNHVLDHRGYRFFQASFDPDEKGTVLSVNHDFWGTWVTYVGYILLYLSMMGIFFIGKTRFKDLSKALDKIKNKKQAVASLLFFTFSLGLNAQAHDHSPKSPFNFDSIVNANAIDKQHALKFGSLVIQDLGGRMKPANTFSSELLRKVSKKDDFGTLNADQVMMSIVESPALWYNVPIIYLKRGNDSLRKIIGVDSKQKYASLVSFFDPQGNYKISSQLEGAYRAAVPNQFQKDFIEVDKRVNLLYSALEGKVMRIFPVPNDASNKWVSYPELNEATFRGKDSLYVHNILPLYFNSLRLAREDGDYTQADNLLESLEGFQKKFGGSVMPTEQKIEAEILYNQYDIFKKLFSWYLYAGLLLFVLLVLKIFRESSAMYFAVKFLVGVVLLLFLLHTGGLVARWFISGHAPWSDAYESMIYVAWATMFFGLIFGRKSELTLAATTFVSSMVLMIAHWNWMDPAIANLQPVLDSYWLMIHVAVIVGSYGPFALSMIIGVVALLLISIAAKKNKAKIDLNIKELTIINELSLTVGLIMLTIGNFLGGMWANESWGRYWGWDPKETWALISILVYAFVIHMRFVPGLRGRWTFNFMSIIAFASILMTYFGVNFYLVGLHSYASGDKIITPSFVYYAIVIIALLGAVSYWRYQKVFKS
ncbi:MAG: cytochrome c biogenesis protein CcsA [Bacteroidetes bacterium]|nr:cytochrome c biogenesis protein CcsA [Bacteroidota bacterium]MDA0936120.1 cytochrome c biogenesis protein CcsA [Bacteroidota bacterium]